MRCAGRREANPTFAADGNLYVGTSASELLHFVQIPPDPADRSSSPVFILASRLRPAYAESSSGSRPGVQQILLLPRVAKACILCNSTVTFYSLPELSPVFGTTQVKNCNWVGGVDLNEPIESDDQRSDGVTILLSLTRRIQVVRIGEDALGVKVCVSARCPYGKSLTPHSENRLRGEYHLRPQRLHRLRSGREELRVAGAWSAVEDPAYEHLILGR